MGRVMSLAHESKLAHDPEALEGETLALSGAVGALEVMEHSQLSTMNACHHVAVIQYCIK